MTDQHVCRHLAYLGPPAPLAAFLFDAPHALVHQAWAPRDMRGGGTINADGFGVGWYPGPVRYRSDRPLWADPDQPELAAATEAPAILAAVRSATPGMAVGVAACAPFAGEGWLFSLNGRIDGWPESATPLAATLPVVDLLTMEAPVDSVLLWILLRARLAAGADPAEAVRSLVLDVSAAAPGSRLNLLLTDGRQIIATTWSHSLSVRSADGSRSGGGSVLVSSEPLDDDPAWRAVPDGSLLIATPTRTHVAPIME